MNSDAGKERGWLAKPSLTPQLVTVKPTAGDRELRIKDNEGSNEQRCNLNVAAQAVVVMVVRMYECRVKQWLLSNERQITLNPARFRLMFYWYSAP